MAVLAVPPGQASALTVKLVRAVEPVNTVPAASFVAVASTGRALRVGGDARGIQRVAAGGDGGFTATAVPSQTSLIPAAARVCWP